MYLVTYLGRYIPSNKLPYLRHFIGVLELGYFIFKVFGWDAHLIQPYLNPKRPGCWVGLAAGAAFFFEEKHGQ